MNRLTYWSIHENKTDSGDLLTHEGQTDGGETSRYKTRQAYWSALAFGSMGTKQMVTVILQLRNFKIWLRHGKFGRDGLIYTQKNSTSIS